MGRVILVRHGQTKWHVDGRYAGTADVPLDELGRRQADRVANYLSDVQMDRIYSSPLSRCLELANQVARHQGMDVHIDERLREIDLGRWDGETYQEILKRDGEILRMWTQDPTSVAVPGGESLTDVRDRAMDWFMDVYERYPEQDVFASSHGGPIRVIIAEVIGLPLSRLFRLTVDLASISEIDYKGEFSNVKLLNGCYHLRGLS